MAVKPSFVTFLNPVLPFAALWRHRDLLWQFTRRNLEMRHKGSMLGIVWSVLNPLMMLALYVFVFGFVFGGTFTGEESRWDFGLGLFLGLTLFHFLAETIAGAPGIIVGTPNFVKKVVFPVEILPAASVGAAVVHMLITLAMVVVGTFLGSRPPSLSALQLPLVVLPLVGYALGLSWLIAAIGVFFRDVGQLMGAAVTGLMFASAIFYPASRIQTHAPEAWAVLKFNPLLQAVELSRDILLWHKPFPYSKLAWLYFGAALTALFGYACFARLKRAFADVI